MTVDDKEALLKKKHELEDRLERIKEDIASGLDQDAEERAIQLENRDTLLEIERVTLEELEAIKESLK